MPGQTPMGGNQSRKKPVGTYNPAAERSSKPQVEGLRDVSPVRKPLGPFLLAAGGSSRAVTPQPGKTEPLGHRRRQQCRGSAGDVGIWQLDRADVQLPTPRGQAGP